MRGMLRRRGPAGSDLPSIIKLVGGGNTGKIDNGPGVSELSTFYIEPSKQGDFTPPGFTLTTGQESTQTIR